MLGWDWPCPWRSLGMLGWDWPCPWRSLGMLGWDWPCPWLSVGMLSGSTCSLLVGPGLVAMSALMRACVLLVMETASLSVAVGDGCCAPLVLRNAPMRLGANASPSPSFTQEGAWPGDWEVLWPPGLCWGLPWEAKAAWLKGEEVCCLLEGVEGRDAKERTQLSPSLPGVPPAVVGVGVTWAWPGCERELVSSWLASGTGDMMGLKVVLLNTWAPPAGSKVNPVATECKGTP